MRAEIWMRQVYEPEGLVHKTSIKIEAQMHYFIFKNHQQNKITQKVDE